MCMYFFVLITILTFVLAFILEDKRISAFYRGKSDQVEGKKLHENPYTDKILREEWRNGWLSQRKKE